MAFENSVTKFLKREGYDFGKEIGGVELQILEKAGLKKSAIKEYVNQNGLTYKGNAENYLNTKYTASQQPSADRADLSGLQNSIVNDKVAQ